MRKSFLIAFVILLIYGCQKTPEDTGSAVVEKLKSINSIHFKAVEKSYNSNEPDTTVTPFEAWAVRDAADTLKGGYVWADNNYRPYHLIYDRAKFYLVIPPKKTSILYENINEPVISEIDWIGYFLKPGELAKVLSDTNNVVTIKDISNGGEEKLFLSIEFPETKKGLSKKYEFILDKNTLFPEHSMLIKKTKDCTYYTEMEMTGFEADNVELAQLKERQKKVLEENPVEAGGSGSEVERLEKMLHPGDKAPLFKAKYYKGEEPFELKDFIGKNVIIVDFWYTHCHPCVKAMPSLDKLYRKYADKGLKVFGLNSVDNQPRSRKTLDKFLSKRDISYDIILATPEVDVMYKVNSYPTMYVVDRNGKIAYAEIGFDEKSFSQLVKKVEELLKK
jgi:peroxiredoxin